MSNSDESISWDGINTIHFQGDSITQGCGFVSVEQTYVHRFATRLQTAHGTDVQTYNHAVGGATALDGLNRAHWCEREGHVPDLTFVMFGLNDAHQGIPLGDYERAIVEMGRRFQAVGANVVVLSPTPYVTKRALIDKYRHRAETAARKFDARFVDCLSPFYANGELAPNLIWPDAVHLTADGHALLTDIIWAALHDA